MVNQILIASGMVGVCEALVYGYRAGLDLRACPASSAIRHSGAVQARRLTSFHE